MGRRLTWCRIWSGKGGIKREFMREKREIKAHCYPRLAQLSVPLIESTVFGRSVKLASTDNWNEALDGTGRKLKIGTGSNSPLPGEV